MTILVRPMHVDDLATVVNIEQQVQSHPWSHAQFLQSVSSYQCSVLESGQQVRGFCILQPVLDEANLLLMAISPEYQGQGLGYQLLTAAIARLGEQCTQIFLEVRESNHAAIKLYQKIGFDQIDLRKNYYPCADGKREHALIMAYVLNFDSYGFNSEV